MENFKFIVVSIIILAIIALVGYWAIFTIEPGSVHVYRQAQKELEEKNRALEIEIAKLKSEIGILQTSQEKSTLDTPQTPSEEKPAPSTTTSTKYQKLIDDLQKLVDDNIFMKEKSAGARVGTVQTFLNIYFDTSKKVDNDYGAGTKADVIKFQKAEGLSADGEAGPSTFRKMIEWLKNQD
jgi:peptidoglycan hydrolase-like protein with peptidoglycan-binding domain